MDRHLAALLKALSFKHLYRSTAKTVNILNTVAESNRQTTQILPPTPHSVDIPEDISRRSRNTREMLANVPNPMYNLQFPVDAHPAPPLRANHPPGRRTPHPPSSSSLPHEASPPHPPTSTPPSPAPCNAPTLQPPGRTPSRRAPHPPSCSSLPHAACPPPSTSTSPPLTPGCAAVPSAVHVPTDSTTDNSENENDVTRDDNFTARENVHSHDPSTSSAASTSRNQTEDAASGTSSRRCRGRPAGSSRPRTQTASMSASGQTPSFLLERHLADLDPHNIYIIPGASQNPVSQDNIFQVSHLQGFGLLNDSNICSLISLLLSLHRISIKDHLIDPQFCFTLNRTFDFPSIVFMKVLSAMPSLNSFSLQLFIETWNNSGKSPRIHPGFSDIAALAEGILSNLQLKQYANRPPVISQFLGSFSCRKCGKDHVQVKNWEEQVQAVIPLLQLPDHNEPVDIIDLVGSFLQEPFATRCSNLNCKNRINDAKLDINIGFFTILSVNRFDINDPNSKRMNKLMLMNKPGQLKFGELVSVVCHRGDVNRGHFVSYHKVGQQWFLNDDSRPCTSSPSPLDGNNDVSETVEILFFKSV